MNPQATSAPAPTPIVEISGLTRRFGRHTALDRVSLTLRQGEVLGLVGVNGSGKTTLIKHILGLLAAQEGSVRVFGLDPVADPVGALSRIGYLSEDSDLPGWMRIGELLRYTGAFYRTWDSAYAERLCREFGLDLSLRIRSLSRGQRARAGLVTALGARPDLLVLDEPSGGLDPLARRDILAAIVRAVASEGRTVLFSSHLLDEVERVADHVALIDTGKVVFDGELDAIRDRHRRLTLHFSEARTTPPALDGVLSWEGGGHEWTAVCDSALGDIRQVAATAGGRVVEEGVPRLEEVFAAHAGGRTHRETEG
jgi:ABC-2 type transport system ATP-binding protein